MFKSLFLKLFIKALLSRLLDTSAIEIHYYYYCKMSPESRPAREIDDVLQITIKFTLEANNRTRGNTFYILGHCIGKAYCAPSKTIIGN